MAEVILESRSTENTLYPRVTSNSVYLGESSSTTLASALSQAQTAAINKICPVGSLRFSSTNTNPSTIFPGTTWVAYAQGKLLRNSGTITDKEGNTETFTLGGTGGEYKHEITINEMVSHYHGIYWANNQNGGRTYADMGFSSSGGSNNSIISYVGGNVARENTMPSYTCYIWRRTA